MNLKQLIEIELGKDKEHEEIVRQRISTLKKKIVKKKGEEEEEFEGLEKRAYDFSEKIGSTVKKRKLNKVIKKYGEDKAQEIIRFMGFAAAKVREYQEKEEEYEIPTSVTPLATGALLGVTKLTISKANRKILQALIKKEKPKNSQELLKIIEDGLDPGNIEHELASLKGLALDKKDFDEFVKKISIDKELKARVNQRNKSIERFNELIAKAKHLSSLPGTKKIEA